MQAPRRTPRIKKLDRGANATWSERDQDAVARADMRAVDRDWKRLEKAIAYLPKDERAVVRDALIVAHGAHAGQNRRSGEPFVSHPVAVSILLADLSMDRDTVVAGLLHDTVEDTFLRFEDVERRFGPDVRALVEGRWRGGQLDGVAIHQHGRVLAETHWSMRTGRHWAARRTGRAVQAKQRSSSSSRTCGRCSWP